MPSENFNVLLSQDFSFKTYVDSSQYVVIIQITLILLFVTASTHFLSADVRFTGLQFSGSA